MVAWTVLVHTKPVLAPDGAQETPGSPLYARVVRRLGSATRLGRNQVACQSVHRLRGPLVCGGLEFPQFSGQFA